MILYTYKGFPNFAMLKAGPHSPFWTQIERHVIGAVEQIIGRAPTPQEIYHFGRRFVHEDMSETWLWKETEILKIPAHSKNISGGICEIKWESIWKEPIDE